MLLAYLFSIGAILFLCSFPCFYDLQRNLSSMTILCDQKLPFSALRGSSHLSLTLIWWRDGVSAWLICFLTGRMLESMPSESTWKMWSMWLTALTSHEFWILVTGRMFFPGQSLHFQCSGWDVMSILCKPFSSHKKCVQLGKIPSFASSDNKSARSPAITTINTPSKRSLHCALNGGTVVEIARQTYEIYSKTCLNPSMFLHTIIRIPVRMNVWRYFLTSPWSDGVVIAFSCCAIKSSVQPYQQSHGLPSEVIQFSLLERMSLRASCQFFPRSFFVYALRVNHNGRCWSGLRFGQDEFRRGVLVRRAQWQRLRVGAGQWQQVRETSLDPCARK